MTREVGQEGRLRRVLVDQAVADDLQKFGVIEVCSLFQLGIGAFSRQEERGMLFERVVEDGPAAAAGLEPGDILISVGGVATNSRDDLRAAMEGREPGEVVEVVIRRGSEQRTVSITLGRAGG